MTATRVALITGASTGIGRACAERLAARGYQVYGGSRALALSPPAGVTALPLDVRDDESTRAAVATVLAEAGRLDVLVNNAGYGLAGALEEVTPEELAAQFATNVLGVARVTRAVLPTMRACGEGRIVAISSTGGLAGLPFFGAYAASKFALEGYCATLRQEVRPFGIHVSLIVPGRIRTDFRRNLQTAATPIDAYTPWRARADAARQRAGQIDPGRVADCLLRALTTPRPALHYYVGLEARAVALLRRWLPDALFEAVIRRAYRLDAR